jgi:transposase
MLILEMPELSITSAIPWVPPTQGERTAKPEPDGVEHRRRWVVERTFAWISKHRRCVRDYEAKPDHHEAMIYIAIIMNMSRRLARTGD